jgi:hypothetical protein
MTGARRSDRAMPELPGNRVGNACVAEDDGVPAHGTKGQIRAWLSFERLVATAIASQSSPKTSRRHAREGTGAMQRP